MESDPPDKYVLDRAGQLLRGRYRILRFLGAGAMGSIWVAELLALKREVVVKFHEKSFVAAQSDTALKRFLRESRTLSTVRHKNVAELFECGTDDDGESYLIMEYLKGETLGAKMRRDGILDIGFSLRTIASIADGLRVAHGAGILHRDIKPDNIFLEAAGHSDPIPKLLDFGLSRLVDDTAGLTAQNRIVGTPGYVAPEQARGLREVDQRIDVYALGVTLYEMLTGDLPSEGNTAVAHIVHVATMPPVPLVTRRPDLAGGLSDVLMKALAPDRDDRYSDVGALRQALLDLLAGGL